MRAINKNSTAYVEEVERKLDVPLHVDILGFLSELESIITSKGWGIKRWEREERSVTYYDNVGFVVYGNGQTLKQNDRLNGVPPSERFRVDLKKGPLENRLEAPNHTSDRELTPEELYGLIPTDFPEKISRDVYGGLAGVLYADTNHIKLRIKKGKTVVEVKLDIFDVFQDRYRFRELEFELQHDNGNYTDADKKKRDDVFLAVQGHFGLAELFEQKYSRIINHFRKKLKNAPEGLFEALTYRTNKYKPA